MKFLLFLAFIIAFPFSLLAQDKIERIWYNAEKTSKIQVYKGKNGKFYGKIVWLKEPTKDGKPRVDELNPKKNLQSRPLMGMIVLTNLEKDGSDYDDGEIYDPKSGKTYSCKAELNGNKLELRGYVGISLIGRTSTWTPAD